MPRARSFDYIIVGAGSAGCVLANRLSADPGCSVLLIEAGGRDRNPLFQLPMLMGRLFHSSIYNWRYHTEPVPGLGGRSLYWPRGKVLGGSSTINGMVYVRGNRHDYDRWAQMGLAGWSYDDVLPAFRRSEGHVERDDAYHGTGGALTVCRARGTNPLFDAFLEAGAQAGWPVNDDFNGAEQEGIGRYDFTIRRGRRCSTSVAFLRPVRRRRNLTILTDCLVRRVVVEGGRATGVEVAEGAGARTIHAEREVILCGGTVNTPQLLMLSGIGPGDALKRHGIAVVHELPGVGRNLQDHVDCVIAYACTKPITLYRELRVDRMVRAVAAGLLFRPRHRHHLPLRGRGLPQDPAGPAGAGHPGALHAGAGERGEPPHPQSAQEDPAGGGPRLHLCVSAPSCPRAGGGSGSAPPTPQRRR